MTRKVSGLDYEEDLALPMPKPHRSRGNSPEADAILEDYQTPLGSPPSLIEPPSRDVSPSCESTTSTVPESKKRSKFQILKAKMSFKDLKELPNDENTNPIPVPQLTENTKPRLRRPLNTATTMPSIASTASSTKVRSTLSQDSLTRKVSTSTKSAHFANASATKSRIPLPPSNALSHVQGGVPLAKTDGIQRRVSGQRPPSYSSNANKEERAVMESSFGIASSDTSERHQLDIVVTRPSLEGPLNPSSVPPYLHRPRYPVTGESPPHPNDLLEGSGKVKYIPKTWLDGPCPPTPSPLNGKDSVDPTTVKHYRSSSIPSRVPTLKERFEKATVSLEKSVNSPSHPMGLQVNEIVEMVRSIQRHAENGIEGMTKKLEELSTWITDQLNHHIQNITDFSRASPDFLNKQSQLSREMMGLQLAIRLEIGDMERHLNGFEMQLVDGLQAEVWALAKSYNELNIKTDALLQDSSKDEAKHFMEVQRMKNTDIEAEIAYLRGHALHDSTLLPPPTLPDIPSVSSTRNVEPLIRKIESTVKIAEEQARIKDIATNAGVLAIAATHPPMLPPPRAPMKASTSGVKRVYPTNKEAGVARNRELGVKEDKPTGNLPRSASLTRKGFLKNITTSSPDQKEITPQKRGYGISDEPKKWSIFGFRRRRAAPSANTPSVGIKTRSLSPLKPAKEQARSDNQNDESSTGSSTPPLPSIPVQFPYEAPKKSNISWKPLHPALRSADSRRSSSLKRPKAARPRPRPPPVDVSSPFHRGGGLSASSPSVEAYPASCSSASGSALSTSVRLSPPYLTAHGGKISSSLSALAQVYPRTPTTSSSAGDVPLSGPDAETALVSVCETETKTNESDDDVEEQPLFACNDTGTE